MTDDFLTRPVSLGPSSDPPNLWLLLQLAGAGGHGRQHAGCSGPARRRVVQLEAKLHQEVHGLSGSTFGVARLLISCLNYLGD